MAELPILQWAINLLILQGLMGAFDTLYHHELTIALPHQKSARLELSIHAVRALFYGILFAGIAHFAFHGAWAWLIAGLVAIEVLLTLWDFVVEDRSRKLPASERVLHTVLAINGGALFALYSVQLLHWADLPSELNSIDFGWRSWLLTLFAIGVAASGIRDGLAALRMHRQPQAANPFVDIAPQRLLVTGGTGFIGEIMVNQLLDAGHTVSLFARDPLRAAYLFDGRARCVRSLAELGSTEIFDAVINLAGAPVAGPRWTAKRQAQLLGSRVGTTEALIEWLQKAQHKPAVWLQASAIGYYGVRDANEELHEDSSVGSGFMATLCAQWEASALPVSGFGVRQVVMRLGVVFGPGAALLALLLPHRFGLGGKLGSGTQIISWIQRDDVLRLIARTLSDSTMNGTYNVVAPTAVSQAEFAVTAGAVLRRPVWFHLPAAPFRWCAGEMAELFVDGQRVAPRRLEQEGYHFSYPTLDATLRDLA